jgi:hypothetical protein
MHLVSASYNEDATKATIKTNIGTWEFTGFPYQVSSLIDMDLAVVHKNEVTIKWLATRGFKQTSQNIRRIDIKDSGAEVNFYLTPISRKKFILVNSSLPEEVRTKYEQEASLKGYAVNYFCNDTVLIDLGLDFDLEKEGT